MISAEKLKELKSYFWEETNEEDTQEWREDLSKEEEKLVSEWDKKYSNDIVILCKEILKHDKR